MQRSIAVTALATDLSSLAPRRPGELSPTTSPPQETLQAFHGTYTGKYVHYVDSSLEEIPVRTVFQRNGEQVTGRYYFGLGVGTIRGAVRGDTLYFNWQWGGTHGRGKLQATEQGRGFSGTWGYGESRDNGGKLYGRRQ